MGEPTVDERQTLKEAVRLSKNGRFAEAEALFNAKLGGERLGLGSLGVWISISQPRPIR